MPLSPSKYGDTRTPAQIRQHYEVEKELASRLRSASQDERVQLYSVVYNELFRRVPHHPQLTRKVDSADTARYVAQQLRDLRPFCTGSTVLMEIGAGDCALSLAAARLVKQVYALDVSQVITEQASLPENFELVLFDGRSIPLPAHSVDVAYSNQLMEHLHPHDAVEQLRSIYRVLVPGGLYVCKTPNRLSGPHDVSRFFEDHTATGFHLKEYSNSDLVRLFKQVGFSRVTSYGILKGRRLRFSLRLLRVLEQGLEQLPPAARAAVARWRPVYALLNAGALVAQK